LRIAAPVTLAEGGVFYAGDLLELKIVRRRMSC
jgi:hypothetical protein